MKTPHSTNTAPQNKNETQQSHTIQMCGTLRQTFHLLFCASKFYHSGITKKKKNKGFTISKTRSLLETSHSQ